MAKVRHFKVIGLLEEIQSGSLTNSQNNNYDHYDEIFYRTVCSEIAFEAALSFSVARLS